VASKDCWVATVDAASETCCSNDFLDWSGVSVYASAPFERAAYFPFFDLWSSPPLAWILLATLTAFFWSSVAWWYFFWAASTSAFDLASKALWAAVASRTAYKEAFFSLYEFSGFWAGGVASPSAPAAGVAGAGSAWARVSYLASFGR